VAKSAAKLAAKPVIPRQISLFLLKLFVLCGIPAVALAQTSETFGDYTIYYNAFTSDTLQPSVAKTYNITRSKSLGLLTVSVVKKSLSPLGKPVKAQVKAEATNLTGQLKTVEVREVDDGNAIYYLSEIYVTHKEVLDFKLTITPEGESTPFVVKFRQQFFTN
jgi:hypothetical protein